MTAAIDGRGRTARNRLSVLSWALYDLADTIFSMNITSLYFSLWVVNLMGGTDASYGNANSVAMLLVLMTAPVLGALSDQAGRRMPFLVVCAVTCVFCTALLGIGGLTPSLVLFVVATYMFQAGTVFYEPLLTVVSTEESRGRVSGFGVAIGNIGSFIGVGAGLLLLDHIGYTGIFRLTALLYLLFALPCFFFVKEPARQTGFRLDFSAIQRAFQQIRHTLPQARQHQGLLRFLLGRFTYVDTVNTVVIFMGVYVTNEIGFTAVQAQFLLLVSIVSAAVGGLVWGAVLDRLGPKRTLNGVLMLLILGLAGAIAISVLDWNAQLFWIVGGFIGAGLGGIWTLDRIYLIWLAPPRYLGEFFGVFSMIGRFAAIIGPFLWGVVVNGLGWGRPAAIGSLLIVLVIGFFVLQGIDDRPRTWPPELQAT